MAPHDYIMLFYGPPGVGKTSFVNSIAPRVLFISTDRGTRFFKGLREEVNSYEDVLEVVSLLEEGHNYDVVCIDHIDDFATMAEEWACDRLGIDALGDAGYGKGWNEYKKAIRSVVGRLKALDLGITFICHETIKTVRTRAIETERTMPDLTKSSGKVVIPLCDLVGFLGFRHVKRGKERTEVRILQTEPTEAIYCKDRTSRKKPDRGYQILGEPPIGGEAFVKTFHAPTTTTRRKKKRTRNG